MKKSNYFLFLGILSLAAIFPIASPFSEKGVDLEHTIFNRVPVQMGEWMGHDLALDEKTYEILETRNVLSRIYQNSRNESVHLMIVASHKDRRVAHPPEVCYLSSHYSILNSGKEIFQWNGQTVRFNRFVAQDTKNKAHQENVMYVYKVGKLFTDNYFSQQLLFSWNRATRQETEVQLIRLDGEKSAPFQIFLESLLPYLAQS